MIRVATGNMFDEPADIRINTVNCVGIMGIGVALAFKLRYPQMFLEYKRGCRDGSVCPGKITLWNAPDGVLVINFPTKRHWMDPSRYEDIETGLVDLRKYLDSRGKVKVVMPALGCGHGKLDWDKVQKMIADAMEGVEAEIVLFDPKSSHLAE